MTERPLVAIYADESCLGNGKDGDNPGAAGALLEFRQPDGTVVRRDLWTSEPATTNNRMALRSVIDSFAALGRKGTHFRVQFTSDSRYLVDGMTDWVHGWSRKGWTRSGGPIENLALWFDALEAARPHAVSWRWVRGHNGHAQNEYANHLATRAAARQDRSDGWIPSGFDAWLATPAGRKASAHLDALPDNTSFRAARPLPAVPVGRP
ncbi:MAG: RNase H family protein [Gemmatimonadota bacterium]|jgi:ribonuclease HI|nr:ribonuclease HI [Gemmatimonadota bacterium]